eukprot:4983224-Amphidinium_carterae.1
MACTGHYESRPLGGDMIIWWQALLRGLTVPLAKGLSWKVRLDARLWLVPHISCNASPACESAKD